MKLVEIALPLPLDSTFTYGVPEEAQSVAIGHRVLVPFRRRTVTGYVVDFPAQAGSFELKSIHGVVDDVPLLTPELIELARYMAKRYGASLGEAIQTVLPPGLSSESRRKVCARNQEGEPKDPSQQKLLERIRKSRGLDAIALIRRQPSAASLLVCLEKDGWITVETAMRRARASRTPRNVKETETSLTGNSQRPQLASAQQSALDAIYESLKLESGKTFLLHGITGSGKTEIYLHAAERTLSAGKSVLALVPEIALTPQFLGRFRARLGNAVAVLHSGRSESERLSEWKRIRRGEARVVIGARSAVFAPVERLGLVVIDEEHDPSYKQDRGFLYHALDLARFRATRAKAVVVRGSATPSVESYHATTCQESELLELPSRVTAHDLPSVRIIDLREELSRFGDKGIVSTPLCEAVTQRLERNEQSVLFLNRRGYAPLVYCPSCGTALRCTNCSVAMTYHEEEQAHLCHYCGSSRPRSSPCESCGKTGMVFLGVGTERVEQELRYRFPDARICRLDRDALKRKGELESILDRMARRKIDILIGTQMVTKGLDLPHITLVGVLLADQSLHFPDFRSAERTFQLLTQVVGRAGRGEARGEAMIQTFQPTHYAVAAAVRQDYRQFFDQEIRFRRELNYPPFSSLTLLELSGVDPDAVRQGAMWLIAQCRRITEEKKLKIELLGPAPAPIRKVLGRSRYHLLVRSPRGETGASFSRWIASQARPTLIGRKVELRIDIDPQHFL